MKASELIAALVDALVLDGDRDVYLSTGWGVVPVSDVEPKGIVIYIRAEPVPPPVDHQEAQRRPNLLRTEEFPSRGRVNPGMIG
jgi:hypothetical protein